MKNRKRNRLKGYDYSRDNLYFVTICVQHMVCCLGEVLKTADQPSNRDPVELDTVIISKKHNFTDANPIELNANRPHYKMVLNTYGLIVHNQFNWLEERYPYVLVHHFVVMPNHVHAIIEIDRLRMRDVFLNIKSLSSLIGAFKTTSSKMIHNAGFLDFAWKRSFHDHIIKQQRAYDNISNYIESNPQKWHEDTFFSNV
ncbi:transposase [Gelidibacter sp.]|uniref:transposase n=1 Tax=Gelidibacter sp. TaxID=2018083 RepID=UPI00326432A6